MALLPHFAAIWVLGYVDRFVLFGSIDDALLGRYEISYQVAALVGIVALELSRAAIAHYALVGNAESLSIRNHLRRAEVTFLLAVLGMVSVGSGMAALLWAHIPFLSAYGFYDGTVGVVAAAQLPLAVYSLASIRISNISGQTQRLWVASVGGALAGFSALVLVVPTVDLTRIAFASVIGYSTMMCIAWGLDSSLAPGRRWQMPAVVVVVAGTLALVNAMLHGSIVVMLFLFGFGAVSLLLAARRWNDDGDSRDDALVDLTN